MESISAIAVQLYLSSKIEFSPQLSPGLITCKIANLLSILERTILILPALTIYKYFARSPCRKSLCSATISLVMIPFFYSSGKLSVFTRSIIL